MRDVGVEEEERLSRARPMKDSVLTPSPAAYDLFSRPTSVLSIPKLPVQFSVNACRQQESRQDEAMLLFV